MEATLDTLIALLSRPAIPIDVDLWSVAEIAAYLKTSESRARQNYLPLPDFPRAIRLPRAEGGRGHPRWRAREVIEWAESYKEAK